MSSPGKTVAGVLAASALAASLAACQKQPDAAEGKGPAEKAGEQLDQAAAKAEEQLNKALQQAGKGLQAAGEKLQNAAEDAQKKE